MKHERFVVPENSHFKYLFEHRNEVNIGELINIALMIYEEEQRKALQRGWCRDIPEHRFQQQQV